MLLAKRFHQNHQAVLAAVSINGLKPLQNNTILLAIFSYRYNILTVFLMILRASQGPNFILFSTVSFKDFDKNSEYA